MNILLVFVLSTISVCFAQSDSLPSIFCAYRGKNGKGTFAIDDVPDRCEAIMYGGNDFDKEPPAEDTAAITTLSSAGKTVYMMYMYGLKVDWNSIISSNDSTTLDSHIAPMLKYLNEHKIKGVLLAFLQLFTPDIIDYATKVNTLISKIKKGVSGIIVGLWVNGWQEEKMRDDTYFNFSSTNNLTNFYLIDTTFAGVPCRKDLSASGGRNPITSNNSRIATLELIRTASESTTMDHAKLIVNLEVTAFQGEELNEKSKTYSDYCSRNDTEVWCADSIDVLYNKVIYLKSAFKGIMISYNDFDDISNACGCGPHPLADALIDAWQGNPLKGCPKIS